MILNGKEILVQMGKLALLSCLCGMFVFVGVGRSSLTHEGAEAFEYKRSVDGEQGTADNFSSARLNYAFVFQGYRIYASVLINLNMEYQRMGNMVARGLPFLLPGQELAPFGSVPVDPGLDFRFLGLWAWMFVCFSAFVCVSVFLKPRQAATMLQLQFALAAVCLLLLTEMLRGNPILFVAWPALSVGPALCINELINVRALRHFY